MVGALPGRPISFYQVSSSGGSLDPTPKATQDSKLFGSCYYEKKNGEIIAAGQVVEGDAVTTVLSSNKDKVNVDLFFGSGPGVPPDKVSGGRTDINSSNQSVSDLSSKVALNDFAYNSRLAALTNEAVRINGEISVNGTSSGSFTRPTNFDESSLGYATFRDPQSVQTAVKNSINDEALSSIDEVKIARRTAFTTYFGERTRRVPFGQIAFNTSETFTPATFPFLTRITSVAQPSDPAELAPPVDWMLPITEVVPSARLRWVTLS